MKKDYTPFLKGNKQFKFASDHGFSHIPYHRLNVDHVLIEGKKGPNGHIVKSKKLAPGVTFIGEFNESKKDFEGKGKFSDSTQQVEYYGDFKNGLKEGEGFFKFSNGDLYVGKFVKDKMQGEGTYYFGETGHVVRGNIFKGDQIIGKGKFNWFNGGKFEGDIEDGIPHGTGKKLKLIKLGICKYENRDLYQGHWRNGMRDGQGRISRQKPFRVYEGSWFEDKFNGLGILREGNFEYRGDFADGKKVKKILILT